MSNVESTQFKKALDKNYNRTALLFKIERKKHKPRLSQTNLSEVKLKLDCIECESFFIELPFLIILMQMMEHLKQVILISNT